MEGHDRDNIFAIYEMRAKFRSNTLRRFFNRNEVFGVVKKSSFCGIKCMVDEFKKKITVKVKNSEHFDLILSHRLCSHQSYAK